MDRGDHVLVIASPEYGLPERYSGDYRVLQPDSTDIVYKPDSPLYFEQVLLDLSRTFAIGERDFVPVADLAALIELYQSKVFRPRIVAVRSPYRRAGKRLPHPALGLILSYRPVIQEGPIFRPAAINSVSVFANGLRAGAV